jgi:peptide methionine sulfoxide reductase MsrB
LIKERKDYLKEKLTPLQYFVTQGMGYERPFINQYWWTKDVGMYSCLVCSQRLFMSEHKYPTKSGYPTFWHNIRDSLEFKLDHL